MKYSYYGTETTEKYFSLFDEIKRSFDEVDAMVFHKSSDGAFFVITGKKYFFRNKSTTGIVIAVDVSATEISGETRALAGGTGLLDISWGAISKAEDIIQDILFNLAFSKKE